MFVFVDGVGLVRGAVGGVAIAFSSSLLMLLTGRVSGISGIVGALTSGRRPPIFETAYVAGLLCAGALLISVSPSKAVFGPRDGPALHWGACVVGGIAVGLGTRMGSGCTSGHGIVGLARLSPRSLAAVGVFFACALLTAGVSRSNFLRGTLYGAGSDLPSPRGDWAWTLSQGMYIIPLIVTIVVMVIIALATAAAAAGKNEAKGPPQAQAQAPLGDESRFLVAEADVAIVAAAAAAAATPLVAAAPPTAAAAPKALAVVAVWASGVSFGLALGLSGMCDPNKVLRFLDFAGDGGWDPQLMLVMGCGVGTNLILIRGMAVGRFSKFVPPFAAAFEGGGGGLKPVASASKPLCAIINYGPACAANRVITIPFLIGALLFGFGWGLTGVCPGPGVVDYVTGGSHFGITLPSMLFGMVMYDAGMKVISSK